MVLITLLVVLGWLLGTAGTYQSRDRAWHGSARACARIKCAPRNARASGVMTAKKITATALKRGLSLKQFFPGK